ncbi:MAG: IclR family transcriptional regulator, partial [Pseudomonadota bacterium]
AMTVHRDDKSIQSVQVALQLMEVLAHNRRPMGVTEIATKLGTPKARVYRHLRTLVGEGYVEQDPETEKYRLGVKLYHLGRAAGEQMDLLTEARPIMQRLCDRFQMTVSLGRPAVDGVFIIDMVRADSPFEISTRPGYVLPFHATAQGKVALAFSPSMDIDRILAQPLVRMTPQTITDPERLRAEVTKAKIEGWAVAPEEVLPGLNALAAPIFSADGGLTATITLVGTVQGVTATPSHDQIEAVSEAGRAISRALGYRAPVEVGGQRA